MVTKLHSPSPSPSNVPSGIAVPPPLKSKIRPHNLSLKSVYISEFRDKIKSAFTKAHSLDKGNNVQGLTTWNRVVTECWNAESDDVKAFVNVMRMEKIEKLRQDWDNHKEGASASDKQALYVQLTSSPFVLT